MALRRIVIISVAIISIICFLGSQRAFGHRNSAPIMECFICHKGEIIQDMVKIEGVPSSYVPGKKYTMTVVIRADHESMSESKGGFNLEASAGRLIVKDEKNTQLINGYLTHTQEGNGSRKWVFQWLAPSEKVDVNLVVMAVAANGDYSPAGDKLGVVSYTIKPSR